MRPYNERPGAAPVAVLFPGHDLLAARLGDWQQALTQLHLAYADSPPLTWLETGHE